MTTQIVKVPAGSLAVGDILYYTGPDFQRLAVGTNGYVLTLASGLPSWAASGGGGTSPGGSNTQVQFNDSGSFGGDSGFTFNKTSNAAFLLGYISLGSVNVATGGLVNLGTAAGVIGSELNIEMLKINTSYQIFLGDSVTGSSYIRIGAYSSDILFHGGSAGDMYYDIGSGRSGYFRVGGTGIMTINNASILAAKPRLGDGTPFASEGETTITSGGVTLNAAQYSRVAINFSSGSSGTNTFPAPANADASYVKMIRNTTSATTITLSIGSGTTLTLSTAVIRKVVALFTPDGVFAVGSGSLP